MVKSTTESRFSNEEAYTGYAQISQNNDFENDLTIAAYDLELRRFHEETSDSVKQVKL